MNFLFLVDPPEIATAPLSQQIVEGNVVTLFCNATGNPQPNITWTKRGNNIVLSSSETLILTNLTKGDNEAVYKCKVQNNLGSDEATAVITVLCEYSVGNSVGEVELLADVHNFMSSKNMYSENIL